MTDLQPRAPSERRVYNPRTQGGQEMNYGRTVDKALYWAGMDRDEWYNMAAQAHPHPAPPGLCDGKDRGRWALLPGSLYPLPITGDSFVRLWAPLIVTYV